MKNTRRGRPIVYDKDPLHMQWRNASAKYYDKNRKNILKKAHDKLEHDKYEM